MFPSQRSLDEGGLASLEEERRLAYVAITRARRRCDDPPRRQPPHLRPVDQLASPRASSPNCPKAHIDEETTMTGGESLWRANGPNAPIPSPISARPVDAREHPRPRLAARQPRRPLQRRAAARRRSPRLSAVSLGNQGRTDLALGQRVFHHKFGYGTIAEIEGNKLEIDFEQAGRKRVLDSFVSAG